jgi:hypothetical protein
LVAASEAAARRIEGRIQRLGVANAVARAEVVVADADALAADAAGRLTGPQGLQRGRGLRAGIACRKTEREPKSKKHESRHAASLPPKRGASLKERPPRGPHPSSPSFALSASPNGLKAAQSSPRERSGDAFFPHHRATRSDASRTAELAADESEDAATCREKSGEDEKAYDACRKAAAEARAQQAVIQEQKRRDFDRVLGAGTDGVNNY